MSDALIEAVLDGDVEAAAGQLEQDRGLANLVVNGEDSEFPEGTTLLHLAVQAGNADVVKLLVESGAELNKRNSEGRAPLHDAIECCFGEATELLVESGAEVDISAAAILGATELVSELLSENQELANDRSTNLSPLGWAAFGDQPETAELLIKAGARMDDGELLCAAAVGHVDVTRILLAHGADPNQIDERAGGTALHAAIGMKFTDDASDVVRILLEAGADPNAKTTSGMTAVELAKNRSARQAEAIDRGEEIEFQRNYEGILEILRSNG